MIGLKTDWTSVGKIIMQIYNHIQQSQKRLLDWYNAGLEGLYKNCTKVLIT